MNREKIIRAILETFHANGNQEKENMIRESLRHVTSDLNLLAFAIEMGIDTDAVLSEGVRS